MDILDLKIIEIIEIKILLDGFNSKFKMAEERISKLEIDQGKLSNLKTREKKNTEEK